MAVNPLAGKPAPSNLLANIPRLITAYFSERPDPANRGSGSPSAHRVIVGSASENFLQ